MAGAWRQEVRALALLAWPVIVARAGTNLLGVVDTAVAARVSMHAVGVVGLASAVFFVVYVAGLGILLGVDPLVSAAVGAGQRDRWEAGARAGRALAHRCWPIMALGLLAAPVLLAVAGYDETLTADVGRYLLILSLGLPAAMLFSVDSIYLTAHGKTVPLAVVTVVANVVNLVANLILVGPLDAGSDGIALATVGTWWAEWAVARFFLRRSGPLAALRVAAGVVDRSVLRRVLRTGAPIGAQYALEVGGFTAVALIMARIGPVALAAHQVAISIVSVTFTAGLGLGIAASVRVGQARGRGDRAGVRRAGWTAFGVGVAWAVCCAVAIAGWRYPLAVGFLDAAGTTEVVEMAAGLLLVAAFFQLADITQAVGFGVLRGTDDTFVPALFNILAYYLVGLPLGLWGLHHFGGDPRWLWRGLTAALVVVAVLLVARFAWRSRPGLDAHADNG